MSHNYFIAGTDTGVGKTWVTCQLLQRLAMQGHSTLGIKPVASGNDDALLLAHSSSIKLPTDVINPFQFDAPVSPHLAAKLAHQYLSAAAIAAACQRVLNFSADMKFIEGVGGWLAPINETETMADVVCLLQVPVILVVGLRVGCLNHAVLTYEKMLQQNIKVAGWIANPIDPDMLYPEENSAYLQNKILAPCLSNEIPRHKST